MQQPETPATVDSEEGVTDDAAAQATATDSAAGGEIDPARAMAELESQLAGALARSKKHEDEALRVLAEMENLRKRTARDVENAHKYGIEKFVGELLPVKDSLELGISAAGQEGASVAAVREGAELTLKMLDAALEKFNVETIDPLGQPFNHDLHQAMSMQDGGKAEPGTVLTVVQRGYSLNGRLVRPAMVIVAK